MNRDFTAKIIFIVMLGLLVTVSLAQEEALFDRYSVNPTDREHILTLNKEFEQNGLTNYPLPPVDPETYASKTNQLMVMCFGNAPLSQLLTLYSALSGMKTILDDNVHVEISYIGHKRFSYDEALRVIRKVIEDKNLALTTVDEKIVRVHWNNENIQPSAGGYREPAAGLTQPHP